MKLAASNFLAWSIFQFNLGSENTAATSCGNDKGKQIWHHAKGFKKHPRDDGRWIHICCTLLELLSVWLEHSQTKDTPFAEQSRWKKTQTSQFCRICQIMNSIFLGPYVPKTRTWNQRHFSQTPQWFQPPSPQLFRARIIWLNCHWRGNCFAQRLGWKQNSRAGDPDQESHPLHALLRATQPGHQIRLVMCCNGDNSAHVAPLLANCNLYPNCLQRLQTSEAFSKALGGSSMDHMPGN